MHQPGEERQEQGRPRTINTTTSAKTVRTYLSLLTRLVHPIPDWWWQNAEPRSISPSLQTVLGQP